MKIDHKQVAKLRMEGLAWKEVAEAVGHPSSHQSLCSAHHQWKARNRAKANEAAADPSVETAYADNPHDRFTRVLTEKELPGLHSIEELALFFDVDPEVWQVKAFRATGNTWPTKAKGEKPYINHQYKIQAAFERRPESLAPVLEEAFSELEEWLEGYELPVPERIQPEFFPSDRCLAEIALYDTHLGMYAWEPETGNDYDLSIASDDYVSAGKRIIDTAVSLYQPERFLYPVGHDLVHIDGFVEGKIPVTTRGTPQDFDSRLPKVYRTVVESVVEVAQHASLYGEVDLVIVRGNHDKNISFYIGETLAALFANHPRVHVRNEPRDLVFYSYGACTFGLTHGEKILRKKDSLPLIFADECPPEMWVSSHRGIREIHTGHYHKRMQGGYYPRGEMDEQRGIVTRALPGLTATDYWHTEQGYRHRRAASLLVYRYEGELAGLHEFNP